MKKFETIEAMVIPVGCEPRKALLVSDAKGSYLDAVERELGGEAEAIPWPFGDSPALFQCRGKAAPKTIADANRAIYADAAMADAGVTSPAETWRAIREGELYDITFGPLVCIGIEGGDGGCRSLTDAERERIAERFGGAESIDSGTLEALRAAFGAEFEEAA